MAKVAGYTKKDGTEVPNYDRKGSIDPKDAEKSGQIEGLEETSYTKKVIKVGAVGAGLYYGTPPAIALITSVVSIATTVAIWAVASAVLIFVANAAFSYTFGYSFLADMFPNLFVYYISELYRFVC